MKVKVNTTGLGCSFEPEIKCPFCGGVQTDSWEYGNGEDIGDVECGHCGRTFYASRNIEITYSSSPSADSPRYWNKGDVFDDGIENIEEEEWANTKGANPCEVVVIGGLTATNTFECAYCKEKLEVETIIIDGCYCRLEEDTNYCPVCGRKLRDI